MGVAGGAIGSPVPDAPAAAAPASPVAQPLAGRRWRCWATRPRSPRCLRASSSPTRARAGRAGCSRAAARRSSGRRRRARRRGAGRPRRLVVATAPPRVVRARRWQRSPASSPPAGPTWAGARAASRWRAPRASPRPRSPVARDDLDAGRGGRRGEQRGGRQRRPADRRRPRRGQLWRRPQRVDLGSPLRAPRDPRRARGAGHAVLFAFDPVFRGASESAEALRHERADKRQRQVLDDPARVADRLAVEDEQRDGALPAERRRPRRGRAARQGRGSPRSSTPWRRSSRATRPQGHRRSVGVRQR